MAMAYAQPQPAGADEPVILASADSHIGPRLKEDLRPYCPLEHLTEFDEFASWATSMVAAIEAQLNSSGDSAASRSEMLREHNSHTAGHYDMRTRLADLNRDGVVAEVIFHGSQNLQPIPFVPALSDLVFTPVGVDLKMAAVGQHIFNQWLADAVSLEPERHVACAQLPMWNIGAAIKELTWAREAGLRAVNFPVPREGIREYDDADWEPFWSACEDLAMPLATHSGFGFFPMPTGRHAVCIGELEGGGWPSRRAIARLIFGGVFERHPRLKLLLSEGGGGWWTYVADEMDSSFHSNRLQLGDQVSKAPSEYMGEQVFMGASFTAPF